MCYWLLGAEVKDAAKHPINIILSTPHSPAKNYLTQMSVVPELRHPALNGNPLLCSCLENPRDGGAWWADVYGVSQSRTRLSDLAAAAALYGGFPGSASGKAPACQYRRHRRCGFHPWVGKIPWRRAWQPIPVFLPGESHGLRSLAGYGRWGCKRAGPD